MDCVALLDTLRWLCRRRTPDALPAGVAAGSGFLHRRADNGTEPSPRPRGRRLAEHLRRGLTLPVGCAGLLVPPPDHPARRGGPRPPAGVSERLDRRRLRCPRNPGTRGALAGLPGGAPVSVQRPAWLPARRGLCPAPGPRHHRAGRVRVAQQLRRDRTPGRHSKRPSASSPTPSSASRWSGSRPAT